MQTYIQMEKRTIAGIVRAQYLDHVEKKGITPTLRVLSFIMLWVLLTLAWVYPEASKIVFSTLWTMENHILPKMVACMVSIFFAPLFFDHVRYMISSFEKKSHHDSIWGVPVIEIVGYLFDNGNFPRDSVCDVFAITRKDYSEIVEVLDIHNILVRGENNSRVLNPLMPREMVVNVLMWGDKKEIASMIGKTFDFFSSIGDKIREHLSPSLPAPRFERRKIG